MNNSAEALKFNPSLEVLKWIQQRAFTHPLSYFDEIHQERIIDQHSGGPRTWLWLGVNQEGGHSTEVDDDGIKRTIIEMAHLTIEHWNGRRCTDCRWLKVCFGADEPRVHMDRAIYFNDGRPMGSEAHFLDFNEIEQLHYELLQIGDA